MKQLVDLPKEVLKILRLTKAPARLVAHLTLVHDVATKLIVELNNEFPQLRYDKHSVLFGAATHDIGKAQCREELSKHGSKHEEAGYQMLLKMGISEDLSRFAKTHASWETDEIDLEDLLVSLADKIWKGKRENDLEQLIVSRIAEQIKKEEWNVFSLLDNILVELSGDADQRLEWQAQYSVD